MGKFNVTFGFNSPNFTTALGVSVYLCGLSTDQRSLLVISHHRHTAHQTSEKKNHRVEGNVSDEF